MCSYLSKATLAVLIGMLFFSLGWVIGIPFWKALIFAIGIIVAMVPEGLLPTLTLALVLATQRMAKRYVLIRYLPSVKALGSTTMKCIVARNASMSSMERRTATPPDARP